MKQLLLPLACAALLALLPSCASVIELEDENEALKLRNDSLVTRNEECARGNAATTQRLESVEAENHALAARIRELSDRLAERGALPTDAVAPGTTPPQATIPPAQEQTAAQIPPAAQVPATQVPAAQVPAAQVPAAQQQPAQQQPAQPARPPAARQNSTPVSVEPISSATPAGDAFLARYQAALGEFKQSRYAKAMDMFEALITSSEPNDMTDNCAYWIGECLLALKRPTEAIDWFNRILISRGSDKIDDALMMRAQALLRIGDTQGARKDYQRVVSEFPNSEYAPRARQQLKALKRR